MHISAVSPDQLKYLTCKFRSIELQADPGMYLKADLRSYEPELQLVVSSGRQILNETTSRIHLLQELLSGIVRTGFTVDQRTVSGYRYGVNQRAVSVDLLIRTTDAVRARSHDVMAIQALTDIETYSFIRNTLTEIVDISILWTPTRRGRDNDTRGLS